MQTNPTPNRPDAQVALDSLMELMAEMNLMPNAETKTDQATVEVVANDGIESADAKTSQYPPQVVSTGDAPEDHLLQNLLAELVFASGLQPDFTPLEQKINQLEYELHNPEAIIELLLPVISDLLNRKVSESKEGIIRAIVPIIDQVLIEKTIEDKRAMITAIAALIPGAIDTQVRNNPEDIIDALAPAMGETIKQQIRLERDAMVDALYPVIGSTISKYMQEVVQEINARVESAFTVQGLRRKIRAQVQGVSEAELILQEAMPFQVEAVFLIHKASGLIISSAQREENTTIEGDLMAGMLTAIRSFASECVVTAGTQSELKEIEYENFNIVMEVAGYCYLATIIKGDAERDFLKQMRHTLGDIILHYDRDRRIHDYDGDPDSINPALHGELEALLHYVPPQKQRQRKPPYALGLLLCVPLILWGWFSVQQQRQQKSFTAIEQELNKNLGVDPQLAVYPIQAEIIGAGGDHRIELTGKIPSTRLKTKAATVTESTIKTLAPDQPWQIINNIVAVEIAPDPEAIAAEIERLTTVLNQDPDVILQTKYEEPQVTISGHIRTEQQLQQVIAAYSQIPGVNNVLVTATTKPFPIDQQLYFNTNATTLNPKDKTEKIESIYDFLRQYPQIRLRIIGYQYPKELKLSPSLAFQRAIAVRQMLITMGIKENRLTVEAAPASPPNVSATDDPWLSRTVRFERIMN